ncbi:MAG: hypothetical protein GY777_09380 [Candidatus Brocadiaceae bacterium]|nr:hypothetical protein [Candidatus Brocadiaceae bacterium]
MKKRLTLTSLLTICLSLNFTSYVFAGLHEKLINKYIEISGLDQMLSTFPDQIDAIFSQNTLTSDQSETEKKVAVIMKESFDIVLVKKNLNSFLLQNTNINFFKNLINWLETPLAQKIKEEELSSSGPGSQAKLLRYIADLQTNPPSQDRITIIQEVERTTKLSELSTYIAMETIRGMLGSFNLTLPEGKRKSMGEIEEEIQAIKPSIQNSLQQQMILTSFYSYRNISNEELIEYIEFYKSNTGKAEILVVGKAIANVIKEWFVDVTEKLIILEREDPENKKIRKQKYLRNFTFLGRCRSVLG